MATVTLRVLPSAGSVNVADVPPSIVIHGAFAVTETATGDGLVLVTV